MNETIITYLKKEKEKFDRVIIDKKEIHTQDVGTVIEEPRKEIPRPSVVTQEPERVPEPMVEQKPKTVLWM